MEFRLAKISDLLELKSMYAEIVNNMNENGICIWDDVWPSEFLEEDIHNKELYILLKKNKIISCIALCTLNETEEYHLQWQEPKAKALYIRKLGVNVNNLKQGIGAKVLDYAASIARQNSAQYLRLFVVNINTPAINLYVKNGFVKHEEIFEEKINDDLILHEYVFEKKVKQI